MTTSICKEIEVPNRYSLALAGVPSNGIRDLDPPKQCVLCPSAIPFSKPKLAVKEGDAVQKGAVLFYDKARPTIRYMAPVSGYVSAIEYGPRRVIDAIRIDVNDSLGVVENPAHTEASIQELDRDMIVSLLETGGLWRTLKALPFRAIASSSVVPPSIIVALGDNEPHSPSASSVLAGRDAEIRAGILALKKLAPTVHVVAHRSDTSTQHMLSDLITVYADGDFPSLDPGVILHGIKQTLDDNSAWYVQYQDVIRMGQLLLTGEYPSEIVAVISGPLVKKPEHIRTIEGVPYKHALAQLPSANARYLSGGVYTGRLSTREGSLSYSEYAVHVLSERYERELLHFFMPGAQKPSYFRTFVSAILPKKQSEASANLNGGVRACIACSACPDVCPVGILPQFLAKALYNNDIEGALDLGLLDCAECGLCSHICPSKIELTAIFKEAKQRLYKESMV